MQAKQATGNISFAIYMIPASRKTNPNPNPTHFTDSLYSDTHSTHSLRQQ